jgi:AcrR family transcriptional regulator
MRKKKAKRSYVLRARAEGLAETRIRITEAMMHLHQEVGPRHTTVSAIAQRAGVERLTVYRHFPNEKAMFQACSHRYLELNPPPQPGDWADVTDPARRTRRALEAIYAFFSRTAPMFTKVYRDASESDALRELMDGFDAHLRSLADDLVAAWPCDAKRSNRRLILRHATKFATWMSFAGDGVSDVQKVALVVDWLNSV